MIWDEATIIRAVSIQVLQRKCLLLVDNCSWTGAECDVLGVTHDLRIIDIEVKISRADLKADANKDKWWVRTVGWNHRDEHTCLPVPRRWPIKVWKHYYAMPEAIWKPELIEALPSPESGVLLLKESTNPRFPWVRVERRAKPNKSAARIGTEEVLDIARLANIRMWETYGRMARMADDHRRERAISVAPS